MGRSTRDYRKMFREINDGVPEWLWFQTAAVVGTYPAASRKTTCKSDG